MNTCETIIPDKFLADNNCIFKVKTIESNKSHKQIFAEGQYAVGSAAAVCYDLVFLNLFAEFNYRLLIKTGPFVQTNKLFKLIFFSMIDNYLSSIYRGNNIAALRTDDHTRVLADYFLHTRANQRRLCF